MLFILILLLGFLYSIKSIQMISHTKLSDDSCLIIPHHHHYNSKRHSLYFHFYSFSFKTLFTVVSHIPYERLVKISGPITQNWIYKKLFIQVIRTCILYCIQNKSLFQRQKFLILLVHWFNLFAIHFNTIIGLSV